jgi:dihydrofolate reductase
MESEQQGPPRGGRGSEGGATSPELRFDIVVAADECLGIGKGGRMPWHLPGDLARFRRLTKRVSVRGERVNAVIMGRVTWESIPPRWRPLAGRLNVVLSRAQQHSLPDGVMAAEGVGEALRQARRRRGVERLFIIGGEQVYRAAIEDPRCRWIYMTRIEGDFACDTFFPDPRRCGFSLAAVEEPREEGGIRYAFTRFERLAQKTRPAG